MPLFKDDSDSNGSGTNPSGVKIKEERRKTMMLVLKLAVIIGGLMLLAKFLA